jgi:hypothetical protein
MQLISGSARVRWSAPSPTITASATGPPFSDCFPPQADRRGRRSVHARARVLPIFDCIDTAKQPHALRGKSLTIRLAASQMFPVMRAYLPQVARLPFWVACVQFSLGAASVTLQPVADTSLFSSIPTNNLGANPNFITGTTASGDNNRALLQFDVAAAVPANARITSAQLKLVVTRANSSGVASVFALHRVLQSWGEGTKTGNAGNLATANEATWIHRFYPDIKWSSPGAAAPADFAGEMSAATLIDLPGTYTFGAASNLTADVQLWLTNPGANFGWLLLSQSEGTRLTSRRIGSREDPANAPALIVEFTMPTNIPPRFDAIVRRSDGTIQLTVTGDAGRSYVIEASTNLNAWNGIKTNTPAASSFDFIDAQSTNFFQRFYRAFLQP